MGKLETLLGPSVRKQSRRTSRYVGTFSVSRRGSESKESTFTPITVAVIERFVRVSFSSRSQSDE